MSYASYAAGLSLAKVFGFKKPAGQGAYYRSRTKINLENKTPMELGWGTEYIEGNHSQNREVIKKTSIQICDFPLKMHAVIKSLLFF